MLSLLGYIPPGWVADVPSVLMTLQFTLTPRFVINIQELYMLDTQGRRGRNIDSGFGLSSGAGYGMGRTTIIGTIAFAEGDGIGELDDGEEIAMTEESPMAQSGDVQVSAICRERQGNRVDG